MSVAIRLGSMVRITQATVILALLIVSPELASAKRMTCSVGSGAPTAAIVEGLVMIAPGGAGIGGALVRWHMGKQRMLGSTDGNGRYAFEIPFNRSGTNPETVMLSAQANTYRIPAKQKMHLCPGMTYEADFSLKPGPANHVGTVHGHVVNPRSGSGIPNAIIAILMGHRLPVASGVTDGNGDYSIPGIGFGNGLTITVNTTAAPCVNPASRNFSLHKAMMTENFKLRTISTGRLRCQGITGPEPTPEIGAPVAASAGPQLADDSTINWGITTADAIQTNAGLDAWNSGHINDILKIGPSEVLVAADTAGVWSVAWSSNSAAAAPLSRDWGSIDMTSLAQGPDGSEHVYAGTYGGDPASPGGVLWETDTSSIAPLANWLQDNQKPPCNSIQHILIINEFRRIVVACDSGGNTGIWWSPIPPAPAAHGLYKWQAAIPGPGLNANALRRQFARLAKGPGWGSVGAVPTEGTIAAAAWGGTAPGDLLFYGGWKGGHLVMNAAQVDPGNGNQSLNVDRTSIASCPADAHTMYAVSADPNSNPPWLIAATWQSTDGGQSWAMVNQPGPNGGNQGWYNQAIAVSPADCNTFAIAWRENTFVSFDGGGSYTKLDDGLGINGHLHGDYHAVMFDPDDPQTIFMGSDGGLASAGGVVPMGSPTFASYYNQHLTDLQFYHASPSFRTVGLVAAPLQDNGVIWALASSWWTRIVDSDGEYSEFAGAGSMGATGGPDDRGDVLAYAGNSDNNGQWAQAIWDGAGMSSPSPAILPVTDNNGPRDPAGIPGSGSPAANVRSPNYSNGAGQLMYVVTGRAANVLGLFGNSDGTDMHWESLGAIGGGQNVTAVSSFNGNAVFVGTDQGNIYQLTQPYTGAALQLAINEPAGGTGPINSLLEFFPTVAFAATGSVPYGPGYVMSFTGQAWQVTGGGALPSNLPFLGVDGPNLGSIFAANSAQVFDTHDLGGTWLSASDGLPAVVHTSEIHYVLQPDGNQYLYLASYGWSALRALLP